MFTKLEIAFQAFKMFPTCMGSGLGGLFKGLFRVAVPFIKRGFSIVKPHLKTAAKGIINDTVNNIMTNMQNQKQYELSIVLTACKKINK